jgi:hypothetical protein
MNKWFLWECGSAASLQIGSQAATDTCNEPNFNLNHCQCVGDQQNHEMIGCTGCNQSFLSHQDPEHQSENHGIQRVDHGKVESENRASCRVWGNRGQSVGLPVHSIPKASNLSAGRSMSTPMTQYHRLWMALYRWNNYKRKLRLSGSLELPCKDDTIRSALAK